MIWILTWIVEGLCFAVMAFLTYTQVKAHKMDWTALLIAAYFGCLIRLAIMKDPSKHRVMMLNFLIGATVLAAIARFGQPGLTLTNAFVYVLVSTVLMAPTVELRNRVEKKLDTQS